MHAIQLLAQGLQQAQLQLAQLLRHGIKLLVLVARRFGALLQETVLEACQRIALLLAIVATGFGQLLAQFAFQPLVAMQHQVTQVIEQGFAHLVQRLTVLLPPQQHQQQDQVEQQQEQASQQKGIGIGHECGVRTNRWDAGTGPRGVKIGD